MNCSVHRSTCPAYRCGSARSSAAVTPTSTPGGAIWRSPLLTHPSSSTRVQSPDLPRTRSGADGASVPAGWPSGARYSTVRRADSTRVGSTGAVVVRPVSGEPAPGEVVWPPATEPPGRVSGAGVLVAGGGGGGGASTSALSESDAAVRDPATCATGSGSFRSAQPERITCTHRPELPSATRLNRNPSGSFALRAPAGADRRFSSGARVTARSKPARGVGPTEVAKIQPSRIDRKSVV